MTNSNDTQKVRPSDRRMAKDSMTSLNLARTLENARADSLTSENLSVALRAATTQRPSQHTTAQQSVTERREK
jgi:hypothetical protein